MNEPFLTWRTPTGARPRRMAPWCSSPKSKEIGVGSAEQVSLPASSDDEEGNEARQPRHTSESADGGPLHFRFSWRKLWRFAGPGWLMSLAYLDPGNLENNLQQGAYTRLTLVWVLWWVTVTGFVLQEMSARLGLVTGRDLAQAVRDEYPRWLSLVVYVMMEIAVIGADVQEVVASGIAFNLLSHGSIPVWAGCLITAVDTITFLAVGYLGVRYLEGFVCVLMGIMSLCFFINLGHSGLEAWDGVIEGWVIPTMPTGAFTQVVGTIGAVIMPHNLYLHSGLVLSRKLERSSDYRVHEALWYSRVESAGALLFAFLVNLAVVVTFSARFFDPTCQEAAEGPLACLSRTAYEEVNGPLPAQPPVRAGLGTPCGGSHHICGVIGLENAGVALKDGLGDWSLYVWAIGLLAAGQASTMVCTYAGQILMSGCLDIELPPWKRVFATRLFALGPALIVALLTSNGSGAFDNINEYLNVLQSVQLPFAMLPTLHFAGIDCDLSAT